MYSVIPSVVCVMCSHSFRLLNGRCFVVHTAIVFFMLLTCVLPRNEACASWHHVHSLATCLNTYFGGLRATYFQSLVAMDNLRLHESSPVAELQSLYALSSHHVSSSKC